MNRVITAAAVASFTLALIGCEEKKPAPVPAQPAAGNTAAPQAQTEAPAPAPAPEPAPAASGVMAAAELFINSMKKRDFDTALTTLDPASEAYKDISEVVNQLKNNTGIPPDAAEIVRNFLSANFTEMSARDAMEDGDRGRVTLVPKDGEPVTIDANRLDGKWLLIAPNKLLSQKAPGASTPATAPAPAPAPATPEPKPTTPPQPNTNPEPK